MPRAAPTPCRHTGCAAYASRRGYCDDHQRDRRGYDERRGTSTERGYGTAWRQYRAAYLREHPWCVHCEQQDRLEPARVVDHVDAHKGDQLLFWAPANHQSLCISCHNRKTATHDMGAWPAA